MLQLPYDLKNLPTPHKLDFKKITESIADAVCFLTALMILAAALLFLFFAAASVHVPSQLQAPVENLAEVRI